MAASRNEFTATEIKAGLFVLASFLILVAFVAAIRGCRPQDDTAKIYYASFTNIAGLNVRADVRFGGVKVGKVIGIEPDPDDRSMIRVTAEVAGHVPVNNDSVASVTQITLMTEKHLEISTGDSEASLKNNGDTLTASTGSGGLVDIPDLEGVTSRLEAMLDSVTLLMGGEPVGGSDRDIVDLAEVSAALEDTLEGGSATVNEVAALIAENREGLSQVVDRLAALEETATKLLIQISGVISDNRAPLHETMVNLEQITSEASENLDEMLASLRTTFQHLEDAGGNASDLLDEQRPTIEAILLNLEETTRNLRQLSRSLADQPSALVRGSKAQGRKDGKNP
jgi:phospholipid/cholesterol/gamma-HCH transport system substrate-binding protein